MQYRVHVTRIGRARECYGHEEDFCDEGGCNGVEHYWSAAGRLDDDVHVGDLIVIDDGEVNEVEEIAEDADKEGRHDDARTIRAQRRKNNPADPDAAARAIEKYTEFHRYDPKRLEEVCCKIPTSIVEIGPAKWVTYRSGKVDPDTLEKPRKPIDYIHEHDAGVKLYMPVDDVEGGTPTQTPLWITSTKALVRIGICLGFGFQDEGEDCEAQSTQPMPELWTTPDGKCLLVIQSKRRVIALMYGGGLGVEGRGIVG